ncbi:MAG: DoxX family protein, partial [Bacteroidaceae bacterium]|nr:DoxX family protein [Bacteroidaceae bacterium]
MNDKIDNAKAKTDVSDGRRAKSGRRAVMKKALPWVVNICRLLLAVTFLFSGFVKANDPLGTSYKLQDYYAAVGLNGFSGWVTLVESVALSFIEFSLGVCLLMGLNRRFVAICTTTFMAVMTVVTLWLAVSNAVTDCGCFGDALILSNTQTFVKNLILLGASLVVLRWSRLQKRFITENNAWLVSTPAMVGIVFY